MLETIEAMVLMVFDMKPKHAQHGEILPGFEPPVVIVVITFTPCKLCTKKKE